MALLTIDVYTDLLFRTDYAHIDATLYDDETKQTLRFIASTALGATRATAVRVGVFPGLSQKRYTVLIQLLDVNFRPVAGGRVLVLMNSDRVTKVFVSRLA